MAEESGTLRTIFNGTVVAAAVTIAIDIALFAWMHFTPEGLAFGASTAHFLGLTTPATQIAGVSTGVTSAGVAGYVM